MLAFQPALGTAKEMAKALPAPRCSVAAEPLQRRLPTRAERFQKLVFQAQEKLGAARIALSGGAAGELAVDAQGLVSLGTDDVQTTGRDDAGAELDVRTTACHVRGDRDSPRLAGLLDDLGLLLVLASVEHLMLDGGLAQSDAQLLRCLHRAGADQHGAAELPKSADVSYDGGEFGVLIRKHPIRPLPADHRPVGRHANDAELVDSLKFAPVLRRRAAHAGELLVETEVALERDLGGVLGSHGDRHAFLGLDRLVQTVAPMAVRHPPAGEFVDDDNLVLIDQVMLVAVEAVMRVQTALDVLEELIHRVRVGAEGWA